MARPLTESNKKNRLVSTQFLFEVSLLGKLPELS